MLENGFWIQGEVEAPPADLSGPLVFGPDWLLEMVRNQHGSRGFFWSPFAIIDDVPGLNGSMKGQFIGFSRRAAPPAAWLTTSMMFDFGNAPLATTPQELLALIRTPRPYVRLERTGSPLCEKAKSLIASTYRTEFAIREVASKLRVSHAHLSRQFKRDFGLTPVDYRHRIRVSEAMGQLSQGESILDVGYDVGFNDTNRFYKDFRKVTGTSPGKCRSRLT